MVSRSWHVKPVCTWHVKHVCNLNLTFISISFWNKGGKVLKCWKFYEKREILQNGLRDLLQNWMVGRSWHAEDVCSLNLTFISNSCLNKGRKVLKCWKFDEKRVITPK